MMFVWFDDPHQYPDKLHRRDRAGEYLGDKYGGWYDGPEELCDAGRQVHRPAARHHRQRHRLPRELGEGGRVLRVPEGHRRLPRAVQGACRPRAIRPASRTAMASATATTTPTGCCGAMAARWSTRAARWPSTARRRSKAHRICQGALQDLHPRHRELARRQQQPRLPGRRAVASSPTASRSTTPPRSTRTRSEDGRDRQGHHARPTCRSVRSASRVELSR